MLEAEAFRRAMAGSDRLMEFLLRVRRPQVYRERVDVRHGGEADGLKEPIGAVLRDRACLSLPSSFKRATALAHPRATALRARPRFSHRALQQCVVGGVATLGHVE